MVEQRLVELIHREIDGETSPRESAELERCMSRDPEVRRLFRELSELENALRSLQALNPPQGLKQSIMESIETPRQSPQDMAPAPRPASQLFRYLYAAAAGLLLGLVGYHVAAGQILPGSQLHPGDLYGTMTRLSDPGRLDIVASQQLSAAGIQGSVTLRTSPELVVVELDLQAASPSRIGLQWDSETLSFKGLAHTSGQGTEAAIEEGELQIFGGGANRYGVMLSRRRGAESTLRVTVTREGSTLYQEGFAVKPPGS